MPHAPRPPRAATRALLTLLAALLLTPTATADTVILKSGDTLRGTVLSQNWKRVELLHPDLGRIPISRLAIREIKLDADEPEPAPHTTNATTADATEDHPEHDETADAADLKPAPKRGTMFGGLVEGEWHGSFFLGGSLTNDDEGEKASISTALAFNRIEPTNETRIKIDYLLKYKNSEIDEHEATVSARQRLRDAGSPFYWTVAPRYDYDAFRSWLNRVQAHAGLGYFFVEDEDLRFSWEAGAGLRREWGSDNDKVLWEAYTGPTINWLINDDHTLNFDTKFYPAINADQQRLVTAIEWKILLSAEHKISLNTSLEHEYDTDPDPGFPRNNVRLFWGIQMDF